MRRTQAWTPPASVPGGPVFGDGTHSDENELVGYARVSTRSQKDDTQIADLTAAGCTRIFVDHGVSGKLASRPELDKCVAYLQPGDKFVITRLSRAMRSLRDLLNTAHDFKESGIELKMLKEGIDTSTKEGRLMFHFLGAIAEWQRELIVEGTYEGLAVAREQGKTLGHPRGLTDEQEEHAIEMVQSGHTVAEVARTLGVSRAAVYRVFERRGLTEPIGDSRHRRSDVTAEEAAEIMRRLRAGENYGTVSEAAGRSRTTIKRVWRDSGERGNPPGHGRVQSDTAGGRPPALGDEQRRLLKTMMAANNSVTDMATALGVSRATVSREMIKAAERSQLASQSGK